MMSKNNVIPITENQLRLYLSRETEGVRLSEIEAHFACSRRQRTQLKETLAALMESGTVEMLKGGRYRWASRVLPKASPAGIPALEGELRLTHSGNGFVMIEKALQDVFISRDYVGNALDGDRVRIVSWNAPRGPEGKIEAIVSRGRTAITGVIRGRGARFQFVADDPRLVRPVELAESPPEESLNQSVIAKITGYPERPGDPLVVVVSRIMGPPGFLTTEIEKTLVFNGVVDFFPAEVEEQVLGVPQSVRDTEILDRRDLREHTFITIDPKDARDFDDAICIEETDFGHVLWVAIADVSHYVTPGTPLEEEAQHRGLSLYLPDRAIPMLPKALSAGICSLRPDEDRLAMVAEMEFNRAGVRTSVELYPAVIRSHARLTYEQVAAVLVDDPVDVPYRERILMTAAWAAIQHKRRLERGSLELELPEAKVLLDEDDPLRVRNIVKSIPNPQTKQAYNVVEEAMLAANEAVGEYLAAAGQPVPWRVHEAPDPEKIEAFFRFAAFLGIPVPKEMGPRWFSEVFESISAHPAKGAISYMLLRSLKQAQYRVDNVGHFALASPTYLHFTSPIRRYPDLMVHRALKEVWKKRGLPTGEESLRACPQKEKTGELSTKCSQNERRCIDVERKVTDIYRAWYMRPRIGDVFEGHIHSITRFGLFVGIDDPFVEGLIRLDWLSEEFFEYDEGLGIVRGTQSKRMLLPGDPVRVILAKADVIQGQLSFEVEGSVFSMIPPRHQPRTTEQPPARGKTDARGGHGSKAGGPASKAGGHKKPERPDPKSRPKKSRR